MTALVTHVAFVYQVRRHRRPPAALCFLSLGVAFREASQDHTEEGSLVIRAHHAKASQSGAPSWQTQRCIACVERSPGGRAETKTAGRSCEISRWKLGKSGALCCMGPGDLLHGWLPCARPPKNAKPVLGDPNPTIQVGLEGRMVLSSYRFSAKA